MQRTVIPTGILVTYFSMYSDIAVQRTSLNPIDTLWLYIFLGSGTTRLVKDSLVNFIDC